MRSVSWSLSWISSIKIEAKLHNLVTCKANSPTVKSNSACSRLTNLRIQHSHFVRLFQVQALPWTCAQCEHSNWTRVHLRWAETPSEPADNLPQLKRNWLLFSVVISSTKELWSPRCSTGGVVFHRRRSTSRLEPIFQYPFGLRFVSE